jgi:Tfp pilus assembly protein PilF
MVLSSGIVHSATCEKWAGRVVSAQGVVEVKPAGETRWQPVKLNETYCPGDTIRTDRKSRADIALYNHPVLRLDQNSTVTLGGMKDEKTSLVDMLSGAALFFSRVTRNLEVRTATVNAGVEGTEFFIRVEEGKTDLTVFEGKVLASNAAGGLPVTTGQSAVAEAGKAPVYRVVVRPRDAVHWALYYPPVLDGRPADRKEDSNDPRFFTARASQLLAVGRVDEAIADIEKAQKLDPKNSDAFALQAMIAVTQNEKGKALDLAKQAVTADPKSATARIALSYAQQAHFDLKGAGSSLEEAVMLSPGNALAWARMAELHQSFGDIDRSLEAAQKAVALNAGLSRTQTVLGFSYLYRFETKEARGAFEKAITFDDADPLPRVGLGLAKIRDGGLEEGRREIEIAMSLDPNNSLIRSYLGKAYYEEKRGKLATGQYEMARSLDPLDPTPYFYEAIEKQTTNRPVEALRDMQRAIELNDNRMVYRSRLLLDQDVAAREAGLARIYADLGFQDLALVEGWKSVNADPANYSAHRFLADSYSVLPRHEIARVSELLQSQLLQPLSISPLQPSLAESNLFVVSQGGPTSLSSNEFNPLFERNRFGLLANGVIGNNSTWGEEVVLSGLYDKVSGSAGQYHYQTDGFRPNNDLKDDIYSVYFQANVSPKTSVVAEYRYRERESGDLPLRFFNDERGVSTSHRVTDKAESLTVGFHHKFSPGSDLVGFYMDQKRSFGDFINLAPLDPMTSFITKSDGDAKGGEAQYIYGSEKAKIIMGLGYYETNADESVTIRISGVIDIPDVGPIEINDEIVTPYRLRITQGNAYIYSYLNFPGNVVLTLGMSVDNFEKETLDDMLNPKIEANQLNPKLGITWNPFRDTTVRAAAFRAMKRTLITSQTLEPTQVAGFNQFYDDQPGADSWKYGIALDQKFSQNVYAGAEYSQRDLDVPYTVNDTGEQNITNWKEKWARAYLYCTPHKWVALKAEYLYEQFERSQAVNFGLQKVDTNRVPLGINFYHPSGLSAFAAATYFTQEGDYYPLFSPGGTESGKDTFWLVDAGLSFRLPQRYGFISIYGKNLFDKSFQFYDTNSGNPTIQPVRTYYAKINLSF